MPENIKIVFTDLDGTLLGSDKKVSDKNIRALQSLGRQGVVRVIATGRSHYSYSKVLSANFPADFLMFSTGAGIIDLRNQKLIYSSNLRERDISDISTLLIKHKVDFMVHHIVPENHKFTYFESGSINPDFYKRVEIYSSFAEKFTTLENLPKISAQVVAVFPEDIYRFENIKKKLNGYQVIRTTSPLDHKSIWMEVLPAAVSKGLSANWLCSYLGIDQKNSLGVGNDYNDLTLLDFTESSYVVDNSPKSMKKNYSVVRSNDEDGFALAVSKVTVQN